MKVSRIMRLLNRIDGQARIGFNNMKLNPLLPSKLNTHKNSSELRHDNRACSNPAAEAAYPATFIAANNSPCCNVSVMYMCRSF
ncbi:unnamed protein product [Linum trigynum]|uniref:Uncharacterized protein n=1 Tax=Linum trigynum TaxID=586398 RepID=A0AAV2F7Z2_9ROSI